MLVTYHLGDNVKPSEIRRQSNSSLIVVTADEIQDSGIVSRITGDDDSSPEAQETSRLKYLFWPIVKLMTLLRFWRKSNESEKSDEDSYTDDKNDSSVSNDYKSTDQPGMQQCSSLVNCKK